MRKLGLVVLCVLMSSMVQARAQRVAQQFVQGLQQADAAALQAQMAARYEFVRVQLTGTKRVERAWRAAEDVLPILFEDLTVTLQSVDEVTRTAVLSIINEAADEGDFVEEREVTLVVNAQGKIAHVGVVDLEASYDGYPLGCPDTSIRRREVARVRGVLAAHDSPARVRVMHTVRRTSTWSENESRSCSQIAGAAIDDYELLVDTPGQGVQAYRHFGRTFGDADDSGVRFYEQITGDVLTDGGIRIYPVAGQGMLFVSRVWGQGRRAVARVTQYALRDNELHSTWALNFAAPGVRWALGEPREQVLPALCNDQDLALLWGKKGYHYPYGKLPKACRHRKWVKESALLRKGEGSLVSDARRARKQFLKEEAEAGPMIMSDGADADWLPGEELVR